MSLGHTEVDIADSQAVEKCIEQECPQTVINAAAYNKVEEAETNPQVAFEVNALGPFFIAQAARKMGARVVHISTDYVFDDSKRVFNESDCPLPLNVYGASKFAGEQMVRIANEQCYVIRTSALFGARKGSEDSNFVTRILSQARKEETLRVVNDQWTIPTGTDDLASKIKELIKKKVPYGIYHVTNSGKATWYEFAKEIIDITGLQVPLESISIASLSGEARRPRSTGRRTGIFALGRL